MITLHVNGQAQSFDGDPSMPVFWYLRDVLGLTGTKFGSGGLRRLHDPSRR
jgi:isoquinoline 1-oxidoreductase alpha subunit